MTRRKIVRRLQAALETGEQIYLKRTVGTGKTYGFVVGRSGDWILLHKVVDCRFDGWTALRVADIETIEPYTGFVGRLFERRGLTPQARPSLDLTDIASLLQSVHSVAPLVCIELEKRWPGTCYIGRVEKVGRRRVKLVEIDSDALWNRNDAYSLKDVTQVCLGNDYCEGLWEMGRAAAPFSLLEP